MIRTHSGTRDDQIFALIQESRLAVTNRLAVCEEGLVSSDLFVLCWTRVSEQIGVVSERGVVLLLFVVDFAKEEGAAGEDGVGAGDIALDATRGRVVGWDSCGVWGVRGWCGRDCVCLGDAFVEQTEVVFHFG